MGPSSEKLDRLYEVPGTYCGRTPGRAKQAVLHEVLRGLQLENRAKFWFAVRPAFGKRATRDLPEIELLLKLVPP